MKEPVRSARFSAQTTDRQPIRVVVFEATRMGAELLSRALESSRLGITVVPTPAMHHGEVKRVDADVALISANLKDRPLAGFALLKQLLKQDPNLRCIMLLDSDEKDLIVEAFRSGALGICERDQPYKQLCKCVYSVHRGQIWANSQQLRYVLEALVAGMPTRITDAQGKVLLTPREEQIASLVAEGLKNREVADHLKLSEHTVKNHLFNIFERLGISSRAELILYLFSHKNSAPQINTSALGMEAC
jgi:DNA-binding NarL/FixJ family response regulator